MTKYRILKSAAQNARVWLSHFDWLWENAVVTTMQQCEWCGGQSTYAPASRCATPASRSRSTS